MKDTWKKISPYAVSIAIALAVGGLSAALTGDKMEEYTKLVQPPLAPPGWLFPVVWTALFILMGISAAIIWKSDSPERSDALFIYGTQLVVNCPPSGILLAYIPVSARPAHGGALFQALPCCGKASDSVYCLARFCWIPESRDIYS